jgi:2-hydroxy-6-oxonona-2,4-dienedioate hydrolase
VVSRYYKWNMAAPIPPTQSASSLPTGAAPGTVRPAMTSAPGAVAALTAKKVTVSGLANEPVELDLRDSHPEVGTGQSAVGPRPIVFLHGLVGLNEHWEDVVLRLKRDGGGKVRSVLLEMPLLGLRGDDCSIDGASHLAIKFLETYFPREQVMPAGYVPMDGAKAASVKKPILLGNSFGGHVALRIALERPDLIGGLVLAGASGLIEKSMVSDIQIKPSREWLERKIGELFFDPKKNMNQADVDRAHAVLTDRHSARAMVKLSRSARRNHLGDEIHRISVPTLVLWGRQDIVTPVEAAQEFYEKIKMSQIRWFENCGHAPMIEAADPFAAALAAFVDRVERGGSLLPNDQNGLPFASQVGGA